MGHYADVAAELLGFTRAGQDEFAAESVTRAQAAVADGRFRDEIAPVTVKGRGGDIEITDDETPARCNLDRLATLKPAFRKEGTVTAGNASSISDGAAALVLMRESEAARRGATVLARFSGLATHAQAPSEFTSAPVGAIRRVLDKAGWTKDDVDLYEINEAFAVVTLYAMRELDLPHGKVNVNGGACALGHRRRDRRPPAGLLAICVAPARPAARRGRVVPGRRRSHRNGDRACLSPPSPANHRLSRRINRRQEWVRSPASRSSN
jgi:acetyl-CoA C-acetyltransferase